MTPQDSLMRTYTILDRSAFTMRNYAVGNP